MTENSSFGQSRSTTKECAFLAVFVAVVIAVQLALSFVPGVELVTVLFVTYSFVMGVKRGMISATAFTILRQIIFGFYPLVLILYLVYFNLLVFCFGMLGKKRKFTPKFLPLLVIVACVCTACFTMLDNVLTPLWYGYGEKATRLYFYGSLTFMIPQIICTAITVFVLFIPLFKTFAVMKNKITNNRLE